MNYNEELTSIRDELIDSMPPDYTRAKGFWLWEIFKAFSIKIYELLQLLTDTANKLDVDKLQGDELEAYVRQWTDIVRKPAKRASGYVEFKGNGTVYAGTIVAAGSVHYEVMQDTPVEGSALIYVVATEAGEIGNVSKEKITELITSNAYISEISNPEAMTGGADEETDEALRERYYLRLSLPATSGNRAHYILWALSCAGVGGAKATRDADVNNKVNLYICDNDGGTADEKIVAEVQTYIDPGINGDGSGVAPVGAICQVYSATAKTVNFAGTIEVESVADSEAVIENIKAKINAYLGKINFRKTELSYAKILNIIIGCDGVADVAGFTLNSAHDNVSCSETEIFVVGTFSLEVE